MTLVAAFRARLDVISTAEGDRRTPVFSSYRPQFYLPEFGGDKDVEVIIENPDSGMCQLGGRCVARLTFYFPERMPAPIQAGSPFILREGARPVARGIASEILETLTEEQGQQLRQQREERRQQHLRELEGTR